MTKQKLILVEDHDVFRKNMEFLLNSNEGYDCVSFASCEEAIAQIPLINPCAIIMDINMPGMSGIIATRDIKRHFPDIQIMMCTVYEDDEIIFDALKAGATGYILKRAPVHEIFDSIELLLTGGSPISPSIARKLVLSFQPKPIDERVTLSDRENEILDLLATGIRMKEIADKLFISVNTVRTHVRRLYEKLQVQSRVEALNKTGKSRF
ncbi:MAG: response regulator [Flavobacteriales bacterium]